MFRYQAPDLHIEAMLFLKLSLETTSVEFSTNFLHALGREKIALDPDKLRYLTKTQPVTVNQGIVETHDQASLQTLEISARSESDKPINERYFTIKFNGSGRFYQDLLDHNAKEAAKLKRTIVLFDYRGVNQSENPPLRFLDLVVDGVAQLQRLLAMGADSKKITLDGYSLGAVVATVVARISHHLKNPVYLWNDRSFASFLSMSVEVIKYRKSLPDFLDPLLYPIIKRTLRTNGWEANVAELFLEIPAEFRGYMYIEEESDEASSSAAYRSALYSLGQWQPETFLSPSQPSENPYVTHVSDGDGNIPYVVSLHKGVESQEKKAAINTGHKMLAHASFFPNVEGGHWAARSQLKSRENLDNTAQDVYEHFVLSHKV